MPKPTGKDKVDLRRTDSHEEHVVTNEFHDGTDLCSRLRHTIEPMIVIEIGLCGSGEGNT